jgi:hypothetical protein
MLSGVRTHRTERRRPVVPGVPTPPVGASGPYPVVGGVHRQNSNRLTSSAATWIFSVCSDVSTPPPVTRRRRRGSTEISRNGFYVGEMSCTSLFVVDQSFDRDVRARQAPGEARVELAPGLALVPQSVLDDRMVAAVSSCSSIEVPRLARAPPPSRSARAPAAATDDFRGGSAVRGPCHASASSRVTAVASATTLP